MGKRAFLLLLWCSLVIVRAQVSSPEVRLFAGPEDLDLTVEGDGRVVHAIHFGGEEPLRIRQWTFLPDTQVAGLDLQAEPAITAWETANQFGESPDALALSQLLHGMRFAKHPNVLHFRLADMDAARAHQLQLLFVEKCCQRGFDIMLDGAVILPRFSPAELGGQATDRGVVVVVRIPPGSSELTITLRGRPIDFADPSPVIQAVTLEELGEAMGDRLPLLRLQRFPNQLAVSWQSQEGWRYQLEYNETLEPERWIRVDAVQEGDGSQLTVRDANPVRLAKSSGFYRLQRVLTNAP